MTETTTPLPPAAKPAFLRRLLHWTVGLVAGALFLAAAVVGFGTSADDFTSLMLFTRSVEGWQANPEFRQVAMQYATRGSDAMRSRPMGFTAAQWIIGIRSAPGMPKGLALTDTSVAHYANFSKGPLSAYLHLCTEVNLFAKRPDGSLDLHDGPLPELEGLFGKSAGWSRDELYNYLAKAKWDYPVVKDAGAVESLRSLLTDAEVTRGFKVREMHVDDLLRPHIRTLAGELGLPPEPEAMTPQQQYAVFDRLDAYVKRNDPELWRTKQVSDFVGGVWGQVFSPPYTYLLGPYIRLVPICQWVVLGTLALGVFALARRVRKLANDLAGEPTRASRTKEELRAIAGAEGGTMRDNIPAPSSSVAGS